MRTHTALLAIAILLAACGGDSAKQESAPSRPAAKAPAPPGNLYLTLVTDMGDIRCRLFEREAPVTVEKITRLAKNNFYDGLTFHRVIPNFMIQGGDPRGDGTGQPNAPGFPFEDEISRTILFDVPGRLAMANSGPNTNGSQFFVTEAAVPHLNGRHTIFGDCSGLAVVRKIARVRRDERHDKPYTPVKIQRAVVERVAPSVP
ncbi:MAG: peptidylprolyl isomerase [Candidatus Acidiferrales bacterium]